MTGGTARAAGLLKAAMALALLGAGTGCGEHPPDEPERPPDGGAAAGKPRAPDEGSWSEPSGQGLQTRLTAPAGSFAAGQPIPTRLELRHRDGKAFAQNAITNMYRGRITVTGPEGKKVGEKLYRLDFDTILKAGERRVLCKLDLAADFALHRPGAYAVRFAGHKRTSRGLVDLPASPPLKVRVKAATEAGPEQIRKLARQRWERGGIEILSLSAKKDRDEWLVHARTREEGRDFVRVMRLDGAGRWINDGRGPAEAYHGRLPEKRDRASRIREAEEKLDAGQPDFSKVKSPGLSEALKDPESLWKFLTSPETPYTERRAAALQGRKVFPVERLPKLMAALGELRSEAGIHYWGLETHPLDNRVLPDRERLFLKSFPADRRQRLVLGHKWTVPAKAADYPLTWAEQAMAPWPWGVGQTLEDLLVWTRPHWREKEKARRWLAAAMRMPCSTDEGAVLFVEAADCASHFKTLEVLARWHRIALDPKLPRAATRVGWEIGEAVRLWDDPRSQDAGQVIVTDILKHSPHKEARHRAAYGLRQFREVWRNGRELRRPEPATAILTAGRMALDPASGDQWTRLYVYAFSACEALDVSPVKLDRRMDPKSPEVAKALARFEAWLKANEKRLQRAAEKERPGLDEVRKAFKEAEKRRSR